MKKLISCVIFVALTLYLVSVATEILTPKFENRYYILEDYLEDHPEDNLHDVKVFGSCHAYTSFNPLYMEEVSGVSGFVYANAGEIIPTTYARMVDQFKKHTPKVALVEIWGINPYETYSEVDRVFGFYLANNLERTELSWAKQEIIMDFQNKKYQDISLLSMNFPVVNYKDRLMDGSLTDLDYSYSFAETEEFTTAYTYKEMVSRLKNNGYRANSPISIEDYPQRQNTIEPGAMVEIEPDIAEYIQKIIDLCKEKGVELIFYRSPYTSTVNELKKVNHFKQICDENNVLFVDLEEEIRYDYKLDFLDYQHLSEIGANKSTEYLLPHIIEALGKNWEKKDIQREDMLTSDTEEWKSRFGMQTVSKTETGAYIDITGPEAGWVLYQDVDITDALLEESVTAQFLVSDYAGKYVAPLISFRDGEGKEITTAKGEMRAGECVVTRTVPVDAETIRVGLYAWEGSSEDDFVAVEQIQFFQGAFTVDTLPTVIN